MIPLRLQFSGIRDYGPTEMNLGSAAEHILITGPNGAGKSTLSFCMGAVLRSSKVDIDGLKSQNLPDDETWRANIHILFKNEGESRIDAPLYIEFRLVCEQLPKQPVKLQYEIHDGDRLEALALRQVYRSGDANKNNFTAYRRELQFKYKIHPDLYYLIWYQQEVNQFSVMAPEERFRIFSEMHRIDSIQKDWETSLEVVKEAHEAFTVASSQQKGYEFELDLARNHKERYENNRKRLEENGYKYALMTNQLKNNAEKAQEEMGKYIEARLDELVEMTEQESKQIFQREGLLQTKQELSEENEKSEKQLSMLETELGEQEEALTLVEVEVESLTAELSDLQEAYRKLPYSEVETRKKWETAKETVQDAQEKEREIQEKIEENEEEIEQTRDEQATLRATIKQWEQEQKAATALLKRYQSSFELKERLVQLENVLQMDRTEGNRLKEQLQTYEEEFSLLQQNQIESKRQQTALAHLRAQNIKAFTLRTFVKLADTGPIEQERLFDAIKYTIFYDASICHPYNDLYHVSLKRLIPDRSITALPEYGIEMREDLSPQAQNHAMRILWWIEQFFKAAQPSLKQGILVDSRGIRGAQEQESFILSKKAVENRKHQLGEEIEQLRLKIQRLTEKINVDNERYRDWNADVHKVEEAEAFLSKRMEQQYRLERIEKLEGRLLQKRLDGKNLQSKVQHYWKEIQTGLQEIELRTAELAIYEQFGQQAEKIERLQKSTIEVERKQEKISDQKRLIKNEMATLERLNRKLRKNDWEIEALEEEARKLAREKEQVTAQKEEEAEARIVMTSLRNQYEEELEELNRLIPLWVEKALAEEEVTASKYELQNIQNQAKVEFENALNEKNIDPNAVDNYFTLEEEVARKKDELHAAKNLLEENEARALQNEQRLETAIAMQVQKINLLFSEYMSSFQFEGQIQYEKMMDKKGRPIFKLFIHVRKVGHRGKLVDVSLKARGGRVGKGVSGGEESLSSLLFALALLQNLENQAGFIVLDEFDSALDDERKATVFALYAEKLKRKLIILSPKAHENEYYYQFSKAFIISHDPVELQSKVRGLAIKQAIGTG